MWLEFYFSKMFWSYTVAHPVFLINRLFTPLLENKYSYDLFYGSVSDLSFLKVFYSFVDKEISFSVDCSKYNLDRQCR